MYQKKIKYTDYNGNEREETFYFHFNKAELLDKEFRTPGGIENYVKNIIETQDGQKLADMFKMLIQESYGIKDPEGRRFMKSPEILRNFVETEAYAELYMQLATDSTAAAEFFNGIFPKDDLEAAKRQKELAEKAGITPVANPAPSQAPVNTVPMVEGQQILSPVQ